MLYWIYILITLFIAVLVGIELFTDKKWKNQIALALILIPLILRILSIK